MSKTNKLFDWEVYDSDNEFIDILTMTRSEMKEYKKTHLDYRINEIGYNDDGGDDPYDTDSKTGRSVHRVRVPKRRRRFKDVY